MKSEKSLNQVADDLYEVLKDQKKITPILVQKHTHMDFDASMRICEILWRKLRNDAQKWALEVIARG